MQEIQFIFSHYSSPITTLMLKTFLLYFDFLKHWLQQSFPFFRQVHGCLPLGVASWKKQVGFQTLYIYSRHRINIFSQLNIKRCQPWLKYSHSLINHHFKLVLVLDLRNILLLLKFLSVNVPQFLHVCSMLL